MTESTLPLLIQAGAVGIAILLIGLIYYLIKYFSTRDREDRLVLTNHLSKQLEKETESREKLTTVLTKLESSITHFGDGCRETQEKLRDVNTRFETSVGNLEKTFKDKVG